MKYKIHCLSLLLVGVLLFASCQRELVVDIDFNEELLVLNGVLVTDSAPVDITITKMKSLNDTADFDFVDNKIVCLYANNELLGTMQYADSGHYQMDVAPRGGVTYKIEVKQESGKMVWAETTVPEKVPVLFEMDTIITPTQGGYNDFDPIFQFTINDNPGTTDYYWFAIQVLRTSRTEEWYAPIFMYTTSPFIDDFSSAYDMAEEPPYNVEYGYFARFPDTQFNGENCLIDFFNKYDSGYFRVFGFSFDESYDRYFKLALKYSDYRSMIEDLPLYYQPSFIYSNVQNGTGIVGSMAVFSQKLYFSTNDLVIEE
ncbi:MAG: DUF4249 domain-containing protein [Prolixibacteraceae bacterium]